MAAQNLTGVPAIFGDLNLAGSNLNALSEAEQLKRKKKMLSGGQTDSFQTATQYLFGARQNQTGSQGV